MKSARRYSKSDEELWNKFVKNARNAIFLFDRNYMDYHSDRFTDHSLLIFDDGILSALFVACETGNTITSHAGLTYGGMLLADTARLSEVLGYFYHAVKYYHDSGFVDLLYKCLPFFLARNPAQDDLFALSRLKAVLARRDAGSLLIKGVSPPYQHGRKQSIEKSRLKNFTIRRVKDPADFWNYALIPNLHERYGIKPVHTVEEMSLLMERFPSNIQLYEILDDKLLGGTVIFETETAIHAQYISATTAGREENALDFLMHHLITDVFKAKPYISFGISTAQGGTTLNLGLASWKEAFGARTVAHDFYLIDTSKYTELAEYA